ncbi:MULTISPECIES: GNAT family N-acetyltransferase [Methylobacterium]|uniref:GNAT family N-acetyltransferase n=1 Tax=Methylobacterium TaxID=407 RepID=UPI0013EC2881|nr:GNAT family N-acetyltransferase [Methylobacterium sp. DB0501]NGM33239.1 GNAT family N-acetyltransferase [Methylobacterium sp. DB0501]
MREPSSILKPVRPAMMRLTALEPAANPLLAEAERHGTAFMRRLFLEWDAGANRFDRPGEIILGAWQDDRLVGLGGLNRDPYVAEDDVGRLRHVYVLASHRSLGVGALLVRHLLRDAEGHFRIVRLRAALPESAAFYRRLGFMECGDPAATHVIPVPPSP